MGVMSWEWESRYSYFFQEGGLYHVSYKNTRDGETHYLLLTLVATREKPVKPTAKKVKLVVLDMGSRNT